MNVSLVYFDKNLVVVNKPAGLAVHGGLSVSGPTLVDFLLDKFPEMKDVGDPLVGPGPAIERPGIVHRLDKDTSGVLVVARNQESFETLKGLFQKRLVEKTYLAVVCGKFKNREGVISFSVGRMAKNPMKRGVETPKIKIRGARDAVTRYKVLEAGEEYALVELKPKTGRMHQLRVHMAALHHPIACDKVYGGKKVCCPRGASRQLLHAKSISFSFSEGQKFHFEADPPEDFPLVLKSEI